MSKLVGYIVKAGLLLCSLAVSIYIPAFVFDRYFLDHRTNSFPGIAIENEQVQMHTVDLYPYSGWHTQANFRQTGDLPSEGKPYKNYDFSSGDFGFFIDFPLDSPPAKKPNEFRIVMIGGSGAQGWGGRTNNDMLSRQIEIFLRKKLTGKDVYVRVINMSMGATVTYENFISLNLWGHRLEPDLILTYSGRNDVVVVFDNKSNANYLYYRLAGLTLATRSSESPEWLKWVSRQFPNLFNRTSLGTALRVLCCYDDYLEKSKARYLRANKSDGLSGPAITEKIAVPFYIHALKSIKKDFKGVPIMVAWQAISHGENGRFAKRYEIAESFYNDFFEDMKSGLENYLNDKWYFVNAHKAFWHIDDPVAIYTHLSNQGHRMVGEYLANELVPVIKNLRGLN